MQILTHHPVSNRPIKATTLGPGDRLTRTDVCAHQGSEDWKSFERAEGIVIGELCETVWYRPIETI
jgi:hypothetical protein